MKYYSCCTTIFRSCGVNQVIGVQALCIRLDPTCRYACKAIINGVTVSVNTYHLMQGVELSLHYTGDVPSLVKASKISKEAASGFCGGVFSASRMSGILFPTHVRRTITFSRRFWIGGLGPELREWYECSK